MKFQISDFRFQIVSLFTFIFLLFTFPTPVYAACTPGASPVNIGDCFGFGGFGSLGDTTSKLVRPAFDISAVAVVIYFLLGAFKYLMSGGKKEEIEGARNMIFHSIVGFIVLMFAFLILQFLLSSLFEIKQFQIFQS